MGSGRWRRRVERQGHAERMSSRSSAMRGDATTSLIAERLWHVKRMSCKSGATRDNATTSRHVKRWQHVETMSGAVRQ